MPAAAAGSIGGTRRRELTDELEKKNLRLQIRELEECLGKNNEQG
jgi:hypothetical protein